MTKAPLFRIRRYRNPCSRPAARMAIIASVLALSACAGGPGTERQAPASASPPKPKVAAQSTSTAAGASPPAARAPIRPLTVAVLGPAHYKAGRKQRQDALLSGIGVNALSRGNVGYYMEVQEADLRRTLSGKTGVRIAKQDRTVVIGPISNAFASGSASIPADVRTMLHAIAPVLDEFGKTLITIHAYTDSTGTSGYNLKLSVRRALAIAHYLVEAGIYGGRIVAVGHGESQPLGPNGTAKGRARNRRVEIELTPLVHQAAPSPKGSR